jgi:probable F420-dependent oxidoreductase
MKLSLCLPMAIELADEFQNARAVRDIAETAEGLGFAGINLTDHPAPSAKWRNNGGHDAFDPFAALGFIAGFTRKIRLHTHIVVLPYRNPFITAKAAATVDVLSEGRLTIGIGSGYMRSEYAAVGSPFETRGAAMDEAIEVMRLAWSGEPVNYQGKSFQAFGAQPRPTPVQNPIPIWGGGNSERAIQRAAKLCNGYSPFFAQPTLAASARTEALVTLADYKAKVDLFKSWRERYERTDAVDILGGSPKSGIKVCNASEAQYYADVAGELATMGVNWMVVDVPHPSLAAYLENLQWAAEELLPKVKD